MTAQVKTARKGKTLAALERAAMRWYRGCKRRGYTEEGATLLPPTPLSKLFIACARHAASKKRKGAR